MLPEPDSLDRRARHNLFGGSHRCLAGQTRAGGRWNNVRTAVGGTRTKKAPYHPVQPIVAMGEGWPKCYEAMLGARDIVMVAPRPWSPLLLSASEPIPRRKLSDEVFDRLKRIILSGEVKPGQTLPSERDLMDRFGVGRPAIREAMQALANMGLISISHGERARVCQLTARSITQQVDLTAQIMLATSPQSLDHLKDARAFFERGMVREAALKADRTDVDRLKETIGRQRGALGDADRFIAEDMRFHTEIATISGNPIFEAVSEALLGWLRSYHTELLIWSGKETLTLAEHAAILDAIAARDPMAAEQAMAQHLDRSAALYVHPA